MYGERLHAESGGGAAPLNVVGLPSDREARLPENVAADIEVAFFSGDVFPLGSRQFFSSVRKAPRLKWLHVFNAGVDHPIYSEMLERGVRLTTSSGTTSQAIAQTAVAGVLMLAREFPKWIADQQAHRWDPLRGENSPRDLQAQTAVVVGIGHIGHEIARLLRALGLHVIGVRRSARHPDDPVDEMVSPERLDEVLPRADWLILACPLTEDTRGLVNRNRLARLPPHARLINIARGEIVDEGALIDALSTSRLAGAYLDVFAKEPLAPESPLWDLPNVIVTPHNSAAASGNDRRAFELFIENLRRYREGKPLLNEVGRT